MQNLSVRFGLELVAPGDQVALQVLVVGDYSVVNHHEVWTLRNSGIIKKKYEEIHYILPILTIFWEIS